jgi:hypothetical protein
MRIAHDRNGDKADLADAASRWVEIDPADARQVDLRPGMGRAVSSAAWRLLRILERYGEIPGRKPRGETERARRDGALRAAAGAMGNGMVVYCDNGGGGGDYVCDLVRRPGVG